MIVILKLRGFFSVRVLLSKFLNWILRYGIPYGSSTFAAFLAAGWFETSEGSLSSILGVLVLENGAFYPILWACDKLFFSEKDQVLFRGKELVKQLILIDTLDNVVRLFFFFLVPKLFASHTELATAIASVFVDVGFAVALHRSRRLLEIVNALIQESNAFSLRPLGLAD